MVVRRSEEPSQEKFYASLVVVLFLYCAFLSTCQFSSLFASSLIEGSGHLLFFILLLGIVICWMSNLIKVADICNFSSFALWVLWFVMMGVFVSNRRKKKLFWLLGTLILSRWSELLYFETKYRGGHAQNMQPFFWNFCSYKYIFNPLFFTAYKVCVFPLAVL